MALSIALYALAALLVLAGLIGALLPVLPGVPLIYAGLLLAAWANDFQRVGLWTLLLLALLALAAWSVDLLAAALGARRVGASRRAIWGAAIGTVVGLLFGLPGVLLGPLIGAIVGELWAGAQWRRATHVGLATWIGMTLGLFVKLGLCLLMLLVFALAWWL